jgi:NitT/TauT family transport system ATP-binding protein
MSAIDINIHCKIFPAIGKAGENLAIKNLQFSIDSGEFVCLVGPSGSGKTTLLNLIAELDEDYEGEITVGCNETDSKIGYIFQNPRLLPWRTVRENIELVMNSGHSSTIVDELLGVMQLTEAQQVYPERLSLGMSRRVSIIRAFAIEPDVLLMDEPFVSLDAPTARQVRELLVKLWCNRQHTVLFVTHDLREAITLADRIIFLSARPMTVVSEIAVTIPRAGRHNEGVVEAFRQQLLNDYPEIKQLL